LDWGGRGTHLSRGLLVAGEGEGRGEVGGWSPARTVFSWNALVGAYSSWSAGEALRVYGDMRASAAPGSAPDGLCRAWRKGTASAGASCGRLAVRAEAGRR